MPLVSLSNRWIVKILPYLLIKKSFKEGSDCILSGIESTPAGLLSTIKWSFSKMVTIEASALLLDGLPLLILFASLII
jgi:hypothetical protein